MKKLVFLLLIFFNHSNVFADMTANELTKLCTSKPNDTIDSAMKATMDLGQCVGYISGIAGTMPTIKMFPIIAASICLPNEGVSNEDLMKITAAYYKKSSSSDGVVFSARALVIGALREKYPCEKVDSKFLENFSEHFFKQKEAFYRVHPN